MNLVKKIGESLQQTNPGNETPPQLAIETTQNQAPGGVVYQLSFHYTLETMKKSHNFFKIDENPIGDFSWNGILVGIVGGMKFHFCEDDYVITPDIQNALIVTRKSLLKLLNDMDKVNF